MKFRISSILWLTLAVACFFAGMHWDDFSVSRSLGSATMVVNTAVTLSSHSMLPVSKVVVGDPQVAAALTPSNGVQATSIQLRGQSVGTTTVSLWDVEGSRTDYSVSVKPTPIVAVGEDGLRMTATAMVVDPK